MERSDCNERHNTVSVYRVQRQELFEHEEQEEYDREASAEKVLQKLQASYDAQGDKGIAKVNPKAEILNPKTEIQYKVLYFECSASDFLQDRPVALTARASDSKSEGWGFKSLLACHLSVRDFFCLRSTEEESLDIQGVQVLDLNREGGLSPIGFLKAA